MDNTSLASTKIDMNSYLLEIANLPDEAHQELISFYEFLLFKYKSHKKEDYEFIKSDKHRILSKIFQEASGNLPLNYTFNRDELHER
ncbi:MAG: hypothetical protein AB7U45_11655 [Desulfamplus sp.]